MEKIGENSKVLGQGMFGKVLNVKRDPCLKHLPADLSRVGLKIEALKQEWRAEQEPSRLAEVTEIAKKAADLGIGPALYDVFVTTNKDGGVEIIKTIEIVNGTTWASTEWESSKQKAKALADLDKAIHTMNKAGIIHHDLHSENVMVSKKGRVYIIDYDMAKYVQDEEIRELSSFDNGAPNPWEPKGAASDRGCFYVFKKLIEEGSIKLTDKKNHSGGRRTRRRGRGGSRRGRRNYSRARSPYVV
jgi:predicted Ser/Thr protein kinase